MKRSTNKDNLLKQKKDIELKIQKLQITYRGIQKSLEKLETSSNSSSFDSSTRIQKLETF